MILHFWSQGLKEVDYNPVRDSNDRRSITVVYEKFRFVWSSRSAKFIAQVYPSIVEIWDELARVYGTANAREMCDIQIHCTDPDQDARESFAEEFKETSLFQIGAIRFGRPDIQDLIAINTSEALDSATHTASRTLLAFCGSVDLGKKVKELKVMNDIFLLMSGHVLHGMDVVIQSYGAASSSTKKDAKSLAKTIHAFRTHAPQDRSRITTLSNTSGSDDDNAAHDEVSGVSLIQEQVVSEEKASSSSPLDDNDDVISQFSESTNRILAESKTIHSRLQKRKLGSARLEHSGDLHSTCSASLEDSKTKNEKRDKFYMA